MSSTVEVTGVLNARNGQFGRTRIANVSADITSLWTTFSEKPHRLVLTPTGASRIINLPAIATATDNDQAKAKLNHSVLISNEAALGSGLDLSIRDSANGLIQILEPGEVALFIAQTAAVTWKVVDYFRNHAGSHESTGDDPVLGQKIDINGLAGQTTYVATNYAPTTAGTDAGAVTDLGAHLKGIDNALAALGNNITWKTPVRLRTMAALPAYTQAGTGVGATLTANANGALSVDSVAVAVNDRILVDAAPNGLGAAAAKDSGIYIVTATGSGAAPYVLTRATDFDTNAEVVAGSAVVVNEGTLSSDVIMLLATNNPIIVDTTALSWIKFKQFETAFDLTVGTGLQYDSGSIYNPYSAARTISLNAALDNLTDVVVTGVQDLDFLIYDASALPSPTWVNRQAVISDMADVDTTGVASGNALKWNGSNWVPQTVRTLAISDATTAGSITVVNGAYDPYSGANTATTLAWSATLGNLSNVDDGVDTLTAYNALVVNSGGTAWTTMAGRTITTGSGLSFTTGPVSYTPYGAGPNSIIELAASLNNLQNVIVPTPTAGDFLVYTGPNWVNQAPKTLSSELSRGIVFGTGPYSPTDVNETIGVSLSSVYSGSTSTFGAVSGTMLLDSTTSTFIMQRGTLTGADLVAVKDSSVFYFKVGQSSGSLGRGMVTSGTGSFGIGYAASTLTTVSAANSIVLAGTDTGVANTFDTANTGDNRLVKLFSGGEILIRDATTAGPQYQDGNKAVFLLGNNFTTTGAAAAATLDTFTIPDSTSCGFTAHITGVCITAGGDAAVGDTWKFTVTGSVYNNITDTIVTNAQISNSVEPAGLELGFNAIGFTGNTGSDLVNVRVATNGSSADFTAAVIRWAGYVEGNVVSAV